MKLQSHIRWEHSADQDAHRHGPAWADSAVIGLRLTGWIAVTGLSAAGFVALLAFALGSFSLPQMMLQLSNLATRYVAADGGRQGQFNHIVEWLFWVVFAVIAFLRRGSLAAAFDLGSKGDSQ